MVSEESSGDDSNDEDCNCGDANQPDLVVLGIVLMVITAILINFGNNIQALGMKQKKAQKLAKKPRLFYIGTITFAVGAILNFVSFSFAPTAVLAPLESIQFVSNLIFAKFVLKKTISVRMIVASSMVVAGTVISVIFGPRDNHHFCITQLQDFWGATGWILYLVVILSTAIALHLLNLFYEDAHRKGRALPHTNIMLPVTYATASALIGSLCVVSSKTMAEVFEIFTTNGFCVLGKLFFWVEVVLVVATLCTWLYRLTTALGKYDPIFVIPMIWASYILFSTIGGGIYFQEFTTLGAGRMVGFFAGIVVMLAGLAVLAPESAAIDEDGEGDEDGKLPAAPAAESSAVEGGTHTRCAPSSQEMASAVAVEGVVVGGMSSQA